MLGDAVHEATERFTVRLASKQAKVPAKPVTVTITDDDQAGPTGPTAPSALVGTITVQDTATTGSTTGLRSLTMNLHLVPTATAGEWRDDGTGAWSIAGTLTGDAGTCPAPTTTISGAGGFLTAPGVPTTEDAALVLSGFDASGATGTPALSWEGTSTAATTNYLWIPMPPPTPTSCIPMPMSENLPFTLPTPGAAGTYTGTTGAGRGLSFSYNVPGSISVTGTLTPVS